MIGIDGLVYINLDFLIENKDNYNMNYLISTILHELGIFIILLI